MEFERITIEYILDIIDNWIELDLFGGFIIIYYVLY